MTAEGLFDEEGIPIMLVELGLVEQRYQAVLEVLNGATVIEVARRFGVVRQTVHGWLRRYASEGLAGLAGSELEAAELSSSDAGATVVFDARRAEVTGEPQRLGSGGTCLLRGI